MAADTHVDCDGARVARADPLQEPTQGEAQLNLNTFYASARILVGYCDCDSTRKLPS